MSRYSIHPAPPTASVGIASISSSVSPSPFAPPSASAPVSQLPPPRASSSSSHQTAKNKSPDVSPGRPDPSAISSDVDVNGGFMGNEDVMECTSPASLRDHGEAGHGRNSTARHLDTPTSDPPDRLRARASSIQVCLSPRAVLLFACVYAYESCDRIQCFYPWIPSITHRHHAHPFLHGTRRKLHCSFLLRLRVPHRITPRPTLLHQSETETPNHQRSYPSTRHRHLPRRHRHHRRADPAAMPGSSLRPKNMDDK